MRQPTSVRPGESRRPGSRSRSPRGRWASAVLIALMIVALGWAAIATYLLVAERAVVATLRQEQAFSQARNEERERVWTRRLVGAILTQGPAGSQAAGAEGAPDHLADLIARQVELETRQNLLGAITNQALAPILPPPGAQAPAAGSGRLAVNDLAPANILDRVAPNAAAPLRNQVATSLRAGETLALTERITILGASLDRVDGAQARQVSALGAGLAARVQEVRAGLAELGLDPARLRLPPARAAIGGPLVPLSAASRPGNFEHRLAQLNDGLTVFGRWRDLALIVPLQRPLDGDDSTTSNFGSRSDPFTGSDAMHAGMDFRATTGTPIRAAGAGKVLRAEVAGGYGNLVEIDHGNGLTTRYGHLNAFDVKAGDIVAAGVVIGRAGSTGRSTGPHLHYETRRGDEALNPLTFILTGDRFAKDLTARP